MLTNVFPAHVSQFMHRPIDQMAKIGEHEQMRQRTGFLDQQRIVVFSQPVFFNIGSLKRPQTAALDVAGFGNQYDHVFFSDRNLGVDLQFLNLALNLSPARCRKFFFNRPHFLAQHFSQLFFIA